MGRQLQLWYRCFTVAGGVTVFAPGVDAGIASRQRRRPVRDPHHSLARRHLLRHLDAQVSTLHTVKSALSSS